MRLSRMILFFLIGVFVSHCVIIIRICRRKWLRISTLRANRTAGCRRKVSFIFEGVILVLIILEFTFLPWMIGKMPERLINMPNKDYWFADERRAETMDIIQHFFEWFSAALLALFIGINQLVFRANLNGRKSFVG